MSYHYCPTVPTKRVLSVTDRRKVNFHSIATKEGYRKRAQKMGDKSKEWLCYGVDYEPEQCFCHGLSLTESLE